MFHNKFALLGVLMYLLCGFTARVAYCQAQTAPVLVAVCEVEAKAVAISVGEKDPCILDLFPDFKVQWLVANQRGEAVCHMTRDAEHFLIRLGRLGDFAGTVPAIQFLPAGPQDPAFS